MTHDELVMLIKARYPAPAYAFLPSVRNQTGFRNGPIRTADAIVMSLFPSRGFVIHGFEVKAYRGDWLKELKRADKAEAIAQFCDVWWVVGSKDVVKLDEVPHNWGWLYPRGRVLIAGKQPEKMTPQPLKPEFVAAILRNACSWLPGNEAINKAVDLAVAETERNMRKAAESQRLQYQRRIEDLLKAIAEFEGASGIEIRSWRHNSKQIGEAVKCVLEGGTEHYATDLGKIVDQLTALTEKAQNALSAIDGRT